MELIERVEKMERTLAATQEAVHAMRVELHKEISGQTWKLVTFVCGFGGALVAATYFVATHLR